MFCQNCGNQLPEGAAFCGSCGAKAEVQTVPQQPAYEAPQQPAYEAPQQPAYTAPQPTYQQPVQAAPAQNANSPALDSLATSTMIFGILGLALSELGIPGIIFSAIGKNKASEYISRAGSLSGKAKVGSILAKIGLPLGIVMTVVWFIYFIAIMATV